MYTARSTTDAFLAAGLSKVLVSLALLILLLLLLAGQGLYDLALLVQPCAPSPTTNCGDHVISMAPDLVCYSKLAWPNCDNFHLALQSVSTDDIRANVPHDLTGHVAKSGHFPFASGSSGDIYKGSLRIGERSTDVAIKTYKMYLQPDENLHKKINMFRREITVWLKLMHPNVLPLFGTINDPHMHPHIPAMVCPWMERGALSIYLERHSHMTITERLTLINDVACGLQYLHSQHVIHGDLSGSNVLVDAHGHAPTFATSRWIKGTVRWMARELFSIDDSHVIAIPTVQSDVYSFGSIMLQILTGKVPYHQLPRDEQIIFAICRGVRPDRGDQGSVTDDRWRFIERCWSMNFDVLPRPSSDDIVEFTQKELSGVQSAPTTR